MKIQRDCKMLLSDEYYKHNQQFRNNQDTKTVFWCLIVIFIFCRNIDLITNTVSCFGNLFNKLL